MFYIFFWLAWVAVQPLWSTLVPPELLPPPPPLRPPCPRCPQLMYSELYDLGGCAAFVADFLAFEPLEDPLHPPEFLPSPMNTLCWQVGRWLLAWGGPAGGGPAWGGGQQGACGACPLCASVLVLGAVRWAWAAQALPLGILAGGGVVSDSAPGPAGCSAHVMCPRWPS